MVHQPVLIKGVWQAANFPASSFKAIDPKIGKQCNLSFPVSSFLDLDKMLQNVEEEKTEILQLNPDQLASFLRLCAQKITENADELCELASQETALDKENRLLKTELPRMTDQLIQAATFCTKRDWQQATIDTKLNIRSIRAPLDGPVIIMGPSNFPLAFNSAGGGDFASAIASGNSVIAKGNPNHPHTSMKLAELISQAMNELDLPKSLFQFFHHTSKDLGARLASHPMIGALAFTGTSRSGLALKESADRAGNLIFLEMSGVNPVFFLPAAVKENSENLANQFAKSCLDASGQFCTKPGILFIKSDIDGKKLIERIVSIFDEHPQHHLLSDNVARNLDAVFSGFLRLGAKKLTKKTFYPPEPYLFPNTIVTVDAKKYINLARQFQQEAFGPMALIVQIESDTQFKEVSKAIEGTLAISIFTDSNNKDNQLYDIIGPELRRKCGRLINNNMPNNVAVSPAMVHGGPYPATSNASITSVGLPASMTRFTTLHCYDSVSQKRLPDALKDINPTGNMMRLIDGSYSVSDIE